MTKDNAIKVDTALADAVSASWQLAPGDNAPEGLEHVGGVVWKGDRDSGKPGYQATCNGQLGGIAANIAKAIRNAIEAAGFAPGVFTDPGTWTDYYKPNKAESDPLEGRGDEVAADMAGLETLLADADRAEGDARAVNFALAREFAPIRAKYANKEEWKAVKARATGHVADFLGGKGRQGKNAVSEFSKAGALLNAGFMAFPDGVTGAKGICREYDKAVSEVTGAVVSILDDDAALKKAGIKVKGTANRLRKIVDFFTGEDGVPSVSMWRLGDDGVGYFDDVSIAADWVFAQHAQNVPEGNVALFDMDDGAVKVATDGDGVPVARALFGLEGPDELLSAIARRIASGAARAKVADVAGAAAGLLKQARAAETSFVDWAPEAVAVHVFALLGARMNARADQEDKGKADADTILDLLGQYVDSVAAGEKTVADIVNADTPATEDDAESDADAALNG